jgi:hypothetical protein
VTACCDLARRRRNQGGFVFTGFPWRQGGGFISLRPEGVVHHCWPATVDCQLQKLLQAGLSLHTWLWPTANSDCWHRVGKLPVPGQMAIRAKRHQVLERIITLLAPLDLTVDLRGSLCYERPRAGRAPLLVFRDRGLRLELGGDHHRANGGGGLRRLHHVHRGLLRCSLG